MTTTTTHPLTKEQIADLVSNKSIELPNGTQLRYKLDNDDYTSIDDFPECYGNIVWVSHTHTHQHQRPEHFDGNAEMLYVGRGNSACWWQPPLLDKAERQRWHTDSTWRKTMRQTTIDIIEYGFYIMTLEVTKGTDAYGEPVVVDYTTIGGIEPYNTDSHLAELIYDMVQDLDNDYLVG